LRKVVAFVLTVLLSSTGGSSWGYDSTYAAGSDSLHPSVQEQMPDTLSMLDTTKSPEANVLRREVFERFALGNEISSTDLDDAIAESVGELLNMWSLMDVAAVGSIWQLETASVGGYARGLDILVDGIPFQEQDIDFPQRGYLDLSTVLLSDISGMELLPAGVASMWGGSRGILTLKIDTKDFHGDRPYSRATADRGPHGSYRTQAELGRRVTSRGRLYFTVELKKSDGYQINSDYDAVSLWGKTNFELTTNISLKLAAHQYQTKMGIPFFPDASYRDARKKLNNWGINSTVLIKESPRANLNLCLAYEKQNQEIKSNAYGFEVKGIDKRMALAATQTFERERSQVEIEGRLRRESLTTTSTKDAVHSGHVSVADLYQLRPDVSVLLSTKLAAEEGLNAGISALSGISYAASEYLSLFSTLGTFDGYPTPMDRYWPLSRFAFRDTSTDYLEEGNGSLKSQRSLTVDLGMKLGKGNAQISAYAFGSKIHDLILWSNTDTAMYYGYSKPINTRASIWGANADLKVKLWDHLISYLSYSYKRGEDSSRNLRLPRSPEHCLFSYVQFETEFLQPEMGLKLRLEGRALSERFMDEYEQDPESAVGILNAKIMIRFLDFHFHYTIRNITDREYRLMDSSYMPERTQWWGFYWEFYD
jgi:outer membrane cobalamin receptor